MLIPYARHCIDQDDIDAVVKALQADYIAAGPGMEAFEKDFAAYVDAKYAVALSSGTAALHACCYAAQIQGGDEVITTPMSFVSTASSILFCGGTAVFADIDEKTYNIDPDDIERRITSNTKAVIPVHYTGQPCVMHRISEIAKKHGLYVIEDAAHAHGAEYHGSRVGSCRYSDLTAFSFHPSKIMTTCEGGMVTTNSEELYQRIKMFRAYCSTKDPKLLNDKEEGPWHYEVQGLGYNYRLSDVMCALGRSQLKKLDSFVAYRKNIARRYDQRLQGLNGIILPYQAEGCDSSWHLYVIQVEHGRRREIYTKMREKNIGVDVHYMPIYKHPYFQKNGYRDVCCSVAEALYDNVLSIPIYYGLTEGQQDYVVETLRELTERNR